MLFNPMGLCGWLGIVHLRGDCGVWAQAQYARRQVGKASVMFPARDTSATVAAGDRIGQ